MTAVLIGAHSIIFSTRPEADRIACGPVQTQGWGLLAELTLHRPQAEEASSS